MKDYFVYLPESPADSVWGCSTVSVGRVRAPAGSPYPPHRHPADHHFTWSDGRILHSYTVVFVTEGEGVYESALTARKIRLAAGTVFIAFPEVWHRYAPNPRTGWVENWIECRGPAFERAQKDGAIRPEKPVIKTGLDPDLLHAYERCHFLAQRGTTGSPAMLSTLAVHILSILHRFATADDPGRQHIDETVQRAQAMMLERYDQPCNVEDLARELGVGYSHLRQAFRTRVGISLKQYHLQLRLQKAQDFLANTGKSVKEIAELLGFDSPFHLSAQFKARTGFSPQPWRDRLRRKQRSRHRS